MALVCPSGSLVSAVCPDDVPDFVHQGLCPDEKQYAAGLSSDRLREWVAGRHCLATALSSFASARVSLLPSPSGAPTVPAGLAGSISHKGPLTVALASNKCRGVGIDLEYVEAADEKLATKVLTLTERGRLTNLDAARAALFVTGHFALKEAIYKSANTTEQSEMEFHQIELDVVPEDLTEEGAWLTVRLRVSGWIGEISANILRDGRWILATAVRN